MSRKIKGIKIDVRSKDCLYITIGKWVIYIDNSTGEEIICWNSPGKKSRPAAQAPSSKLQAPSLKKDTI